MRYLGISVLIICLSNASHAQSGNRFKVALGSGLGAYPIIGPMMFAEPSFKLNSTFMISARVEGIIGPDATGNGSTSVGSYGIQISRFFPTYQQPFRPFAGMGIHRYHIGSGLGMMNDSQTNVEPQFGVNPRIGFHYRHLFVSLEFNSVLKATRTSYSIIPSPTPNPVYTDNLQVNYWCLKIGVLLHAGKQP
ncbi:MAG TPA: hypothetical protein PLX35_02185 [Cyclobacteriaceae bacterium]|nr:hypothetical protein [Cyclobacteriaceae bacterium]